MAFSPIDAIVKIQPFRMRFEINRLLDLRFTDPKSVLQAPSYRPIRKVHYFEQFCMLNDSGFVEDVDIPGIPIVWSIFV